MGNVAPVEQRPLQSAESTDMALQATGAPECEGIAGAALLCPAWQLIAMG